MSTRLTIGQLARQSGLSRSTLLYYDRLGLLTTKSRSDGNYRLYSPTDADRLKQICFYRGMGIPLKEIARLLEQARGAEPSEQILQRRLETLANQIAACQEQERQIVRLLEQLSLRRAAQRRGRSGQSPTAGHAGGSQGNPKRKESAMLSKQRWVEVMRAAGFKDEDMLRWHQSFEKMEPQAHQEFLESMGLPKSEIARIRESSAAK